MSARRNVIAGGVLVLLLASLGFLAWQQRLAAEQAARATLRQEVVGRGTIVATVSASGNLAPQEQISLFFAAPSALPVTEVSVVLGQRVSAGDVLARLDDAELLLAVAQAEQAVRAAELNLALLQAPPRPEDVLVAEANLRVAQAQVFAASQGNSPETVEIARLNLLLAQNALNQTYDTMDALVEQGRWAEKNALQAQADRQVEEARIADLRYHQAQADPGFGPAASALAAVEQAQAALDRLKAGPVSEDLEIARLQVSQAQAALEAARHNLSQSRLVAPFDGVVAAVNVRVGEPAVSALPAIVLADVSRFFLDVAVDEVDVARVSPGQAVTITLDALPDALLSGVVDRIAPTATVNQGVVSYAVRLALNPAQAALRGGMTATAEIVVEAAHDVVLIPNWAIRRDRQTGQAFAGVLRDGAVVDVPVELGLRNETLSQVISGVAAGEVVAVEAGREAFSLFGGGE